MKKVIFSLIFATGCTLVMAQQDSQSKDSEKKMAWNIGVQVGLPLGTFGTNNSPGYSGFVEAEKPISGNIVGFAQVSYLNFQGKSIDDGFGNSIQNNEVEIATAQVGAKYRLNNLDLGAGLGLGIASAGEFTNTGFLFSPIATYHFSRWSVHAAYNIFSVSGGSGSWISLGLAFKL